MLLNSWMHDGSNKIYWQNKTMQRFQFFFKREKKREEISYIQIYSKFKIQNI